MIQPLPIAFSGAPGSPYTRKMLAVLRYRRLPYRFLTGDISPFGLPQPKVRLLPTFYLQGPDRALEAITDSTPLIRRFDAAFEARRVRPDDEALAFLDDLLEDFGDEWLTKAMFHYRWTYAADIEKSSRVLPNWMGAPLEDEALSRAAAAFSGRQIPRLRFVGSNPTTGPLIEASYRRVLDALEGLLRHRKFLLGARPGAGDFAVFGQMTQLVRFDPTPMALAAMTAPRVSAWVDYVEDLSGLEPNTSDWIDPSAPGEALTALLAEAGRTYAPLMLANARAMADGASTVDLEIDGRPWSQQPFPYHVKCLASLRSAHAHLSEEARRLLQPLLERTGLSLLFGG